MALLQTSMVRLAVAAASAGNTSAAAAAAMATASGRGLGALWHAHYQHARLQQQQHARRAFAVVSGEDSHEDFKPQYKSPPVGDAEATIKADIGGSQVFIYMKGTPDAPQCGFSNMACRILDAYNFKYGSRNVLADDSVREGIKKFTGWPTIPQVFVKGEFIGGSDILMEMHKAGELSTLADELSSGSSSVDSSSSSSST